MDKLEFNEKEIESPEWKHLRILLLLTNILFEVSGKNEKSKELSTIVLQFLLSRSDFGSTIEGVFIPFEVPPAPPSKEEGSLIRSFVAKVRKALDNIDSQALNNSLKKNVTRFCCEKIRQRLEILLIREKSTLKA